MNRYFKIECYSLGGETVMGVISKEQYDYWTEEQLENEWGTMESGMGLIETDEKGLNKKNLNFYNIEVYGEPTCCAVSYNDKRYDLIGNSSTQSTQMNLYKGSS